MGDQKYSELYTSLLAFLEKHGQAVHEDISERGMTSERALEFIGMLEAHQVPILGLEIWRDLPRGYAIDITSIWYCATGKHYQYAEARDGLQLANPGPRDLVAVQFG